MSRPGDGVECHPGWGDARSRSETQIENRGNGMDLGARQQTSCANRHAVRPPTKRRDMECGFVCACAAHVRI
eukprot:7110433-Prymnesium_polylepis.1